MPMKPICKYLLVACCLLMGCGPSAPRHTNPTPENIALSPVPEDIRSLPGFSSTQVADPVFGGTIYILEAGPRTAPPLVLVHGVGAQGTADWYPVLEGLSAHYRVLALDLPGFGRSSKSDILYTPDNYVKAIREVTKNRIEKPFYLLGHSMGGAIALLYAGTYPEDVSRLVLADVAGILHRHALAEHADTLITESTPTPVRGPVGMFTHAVKQTLRSTDVSPGRLISEETNRDAPIGDNPQTISAISLIQYNFGPAAGAVNAPTMLLWGKDDNVAPMRTARALRSRIRGADLTVFEHSAHVPMATEPEAFVDAVHGYLQPAEPAPPARSTNATNQGHGRCQDQIGARFEGSYDTITINNCKGVTLSQVTAGTISIIGSTVTIDDAAIQGADIGLTAIRSKIVMTGGRIFAETAIHADDAALDLAGVHLVGNTRVFSETSSASLLCSICRVESPHINVDLHDLIRIAPNHPLEHGPHP